MLNGGLTAWPAIERELANVDGVMLGRAAYHDPMILAPIDWHVFGDTAPPPSRAAVLRAMMPYVAAQRARGVPLRSIARHMLGLYHGMPGGRRFRQILSDAARLNDAGPELLQEALGGGRARARRGGLIDYLSCLCLRRQRAEKRGRSSGDATGGACPALPRSASASSAPPGITRRNWSGATSIMMVAAA